MLTHGTTVTTGQIYINGMSGRDQPTIVRPLTFHVETQMLNHFFFQIFQYKTLFGYCPQVDALNSYMTAYEILKYMTWIRGTPRHRIHREVEKWLKRMDLVRYKNVKIKYYSGGTKRKLNTAIAMVNIPIFQFDYFVDIYTKLIPNVRSFNVDCCTSVDPIGRAHHRR